MRNLSHNETFMLDRTTTIWGCRVRLFARLSSNGEKVIIACNDQDCVEAMSLYAKRWEIETLFSCYKGRGFGLEDTHLTNMERVSQLVAVCSLAFCWAYHIGLVADKRHPYKRRPKKHGRPQQSLFVYGLDKLIEGLRMLFYEGRKAVLHRLASYLTPHPKPLY